MGVLETRQGDGTYVTSLDASLLLAPMAFLVDLGTEADAFHLQAVRRVLETEAAGRAAQLITDAAIGEASDILAQVEPLLTSTSDDHFMRSSRPTSRSIVVAHASGNPALEALIEALATRTVRGRLWRAISEEGALSLHAPTRPSCRPSLDAIRTRRGFGWGRTCWRQEFLHDHPQVAGWRRRLLDPQPPSVSG